LRGIFTKAIPRGLLWSVANVLSVPSGANTKIASALESPDAYHDIIADMSGGL